MAICNQCAAQKNSDFKDFVEDIPCIPLQNISIVKAFSWDVLNLLHIRHNHWLHFSINTEETSEFFSSW